MIYEKLYDWQKQIVDKNMWRTDFGLFLDMGLGKTPISLAFAEQHLCTKILIITVNSKTSETEFTKDSWFYWAKQSSIKYNLVTKQTYKPQIEPECFMVNYEYLYSRSKSKKGFQLRDMIIQFCESCKNQNVAIIVDESHACKNLSSSQTKAVNKIRSLLKIKSKNLYTYLLSGTPFTKEYIDTYSQLKLLGHKGTKAEFEAEFCIKGELKGLLGWQQPIVAYKNIEKLFELIHKYSITIKSDLVVNLPDKIFVNYQTEISPEFIGLTRDKLKERDIYYIIKKHKINPVQSYSLSDKKVNNPFFRNMSYPDTQWFATTTGLFHLRARQLSIGFQGNAEKSTWFDMSRLNLLETFLTNNEDNYVLFYNYVPEMIEIYNICEKLEYNIDIYCGDIKSLYFYEKYSNSNESEKLVSKKNIIIANFASASTGMNWQAYNKCIIFSLPSFKDWAQGLKRIHRSGQTKTVFYYVFSQNNWLDARIKNSLEKGEEYTDDLFAHDVENMKLELFEKENEI